MLIEEKARILFVKFYSDQHQLTALDLAIAQFRQKSARARDMWDNAANALAYMRMHLKTGSLTHNKRKVKPKTKLSREIQTVFAQASRR